MTLPVQQNPPGLRPPSLENGGLKVSLSSRGDVPMNVGTEGFRSFLVSKNYSSSTIRNYLSDISAYFKFVETQKNLTSSIYDPTSISAYLKTIQPDPNYSRYLSSLSKFFQYAQNQGLTKTNPLKSALRDKKPNLDEILNNYQEFLGKKKSESTIRNYLNDIRQFVDWTKSTPNPLRRLSRYCGNERRGIESSPFVKRESPKGKGFEKFKLLFSSPFVKGESVPQRRDEGDLKN